MRSLASQCTDLELSEFVERIIHIRIKTLPIIAVFLDVIYSSHWELQCNSDNRHHDSDYDLGLSSILTLSGMCISACLSLIAQIQVMYIKVNLLSVFKHDIDIVGDHSTS